MRAVRTSRPQARCQARRADKQDRQLVAWARGYSKRDQHARAGVDMPDHIRSDNGPEFTAWAVREWLVRMGARTLYIEPGSPWENGYIESFNGKLRDELLDREVFYTMLEVRVLTERYRRTYNQVRPHSSLGYQPPAPEALMPADPVPVPVGLT